MGKGDRVKKGLEKGKEGFKVINTLVIQVWTLLHHQQHSNLLHQEKLHQAQNYKTLKLIPQKNKTNS